jgi:hypothetical protein
MPDLSVIIVSWNTRDLLRECLRSVVSRQSSVVSHQSSVVSLQSSQASILKTEDCQLTTEVLVIDNASTDGSAGMVCTEFPEAQLIVNRENVGFARANNQGIRASQGRYVVLLNSDTIVRPGALAKLVAFMDDHPQAGAVGPRLRRGDGAVQPYAFGGDPTLGYLLRRGANRLLFRRHLHDWATDVVQDVDWVAGTCLTVRREAFEGVGLLDESIFMYFEDNDWCLRLRQAGWKVYYNPQAEIVHIGGQSLAKNPAAQRSYHESLRYFYAKHYGPAAELLLRLLTLFYARLTMAG